MVISDHRPKQLRVRETVRKWWKSGKVPKIKWEVVQDGGKMKESSERTRQLKEKGD